VANSPELAMRQLGVSKSGLRIYRMRIKIEESFKEVIEGIISRTLSIKGLVLKDVRS
jgi:hypothetical protein